MFRDNLIMGKTLLKLAVGLLATTVATASFLVGLNWDKFKENPQNVQNTSYVSENNSNKPVKRETRKNLEDYFIQDREITNITRYSTDTPNPVIANVKDLSEEDRKAYESNKIIRVGLGEYVLSGTENSSEKNLSLSILEFESSQARKEFLEKNKDEIAYPIFVKDNVVSLIERVTPKGINPQGPFSEEQQTTYFNFLSNYAAKNGMQIISNENQIEKINMYETNSNSASTDNPQASSVANAFTNNRTTEPANVITKNDFEKFFLEKDEFIGLNILSVEEEERLTGLSEKILRENAQFNCYQIIPRTIQDGNPYIAGLEDLMKERRSVGNLTNYGEAFYFIPTEKESKQTRRNNSIINFTAFQFDSSIDAEEAMVRMDGYTERIDDMRLIKGNTVIAISAKYQINTPMQAATYLRAVENYRRRIGAKIFAKNEDAERGLEEKLGNAYKIFNSSFNNNNSDDLYNALGFYFDSTPKGRMGLSNQNALDEQYYAQLRQMYSEVR